PSASRAARRRCVERTAGHCSLRARERARTEQGRALARERGAEGARGTEAGAATERQQGSDEEPAERSRLQPAVHPPRGGDAHPQASVLVTNMCRRSRLRSLAALFGVAFLLATPSAGADDKKACADAYVKAQRLRQDAKLRAARDQLLICAMDSCPSSLRQ